MFLPLFWRRKSPNDEIKDQPSQDNLFLKLAEFAFKKGQEKLGIKINTLGPVPNEQSSRQTFLQYIKNVYDMLEVGLGPTVARELFEQELISFKRMYGVNERYFEFLKELPIPVMEAERLAVLSRAELETELRARIKELEDIKANLEGIISIRTRAISAERNKLSIALSSINDAVIAVDLKRMVVICNKVAERIIGSPVNNILGRPLEQFIQLYDKNELLLPDTFCPIRMDPFEGIIFQKENLKLVTRPQLDSAKTKEYLVNLIASKITEGVDVNVGCILAIHDRTEEKKLEEMKLDFVSMAAHELRTPLTSMKGYIYIFMRDYLKTMDEKQATILQRLNISAQKLVTLVENLLNIAKIERGTFTVNIQVVDWTTNVKNEIAEVMPQAEDKKLGLTLNIPSVSLPKVSVDPLRINEVLSNLLTNAITYTAAGGKITVWVEQKGDEIITHISDTGQGIPKEALPHLFTKFFRVSGPLEQGSKGTGLGLYIAKSIITLHSGKIWVESVLGKGSTFSFSLPVYKGG